MAETSISGIEFKIVGTTTRARSSVDKLVTSLKGLKSALGSTSTAKMSKELDDLDKHAKKNTTTLGKLFKSIGRIAFYRTIRAALRFITDGFKEGLENAYQFSKMVGYELAGTMDNLATKSLTMKNQLGSAFGGLIQTLEPILIQIISLVTKAANALAQLFAIIGGRKTYLKAVDTMTQYGEAVGGVGQAAKEAMRYLAPFDELNVLPAEREPSGGGGGTSTPDYSQMFEVTEVDSDSILGSLANMYNSMADWFEAQDWKSLGSSVWEGLEKAFSDEGKAKDVVQALFRMIGSVTGATVGFVWGFISEAVESIMKSFKDNIRDYDGDNKIGITDVLTGIWNTAISPFVWIDENIVKPFWRGFTGALLGEEREPLTINDVLGKLPTNQEWIDWGKNVWKKIKEGVDSGWKSIKEGWADFKTELYNIFIKPIVDAFDEFAKNHPKIAKFLGIENGASDVLAPGEAAGESMWGGTFELDAEVTGIKDSVPKEKRTLKDFFADLFGVKDDIPENDKNVSGVKAVLGSTDDTKLTLAQRAINKVKAIFGITDSNSLTTEDKTIPTIADYQDVVSRASLSKDKRTIPTWADYKYVISTASLSKGNRTLPVWADYQYIISKASLSKGNRTIPTWADYQYVDKSNLTTPMKTIPTTSAYTKADKSGLTDPQKTIPTTSKYTKTQDALTESQKTFSSKANFNTWKDSLSNVWSYAKSWFNSWSNDYGYDTPWADAEAKFNDWSDNINRYSNEPTIGTKANLNDWSNGIDYYYNPPTVSVNGKITYAYPDPYLETPTIDVNARITGSGGNYTMASGGAYYGNRWHDIPQAASGGKFHGTLFWAGEQGAEVVGHAGGRTEVLNRSQLAATMYAAVKSAMSGFRFNVGSMNVPTASADSYDEEAMYRAMLRALNDSDVGDNEITLDGDVLYRKMVQRNQMHTRMTGVNVMATA